MREETPEHHRPLRTGFTTGACATATSLAAARLLLHDTVSQHVTITLPRGQQVRFDLTGCVRLGATRARADTVKDAGDDPDATHGATVFAEVELAAEPGVRFHAAEGVGVVTRAGLVLEVGEPAINPMPRRMMREHLEELARQADYAGGFEVHVGIRDGERIALDTMNGRLGIVGGLSILGTTGIVRPYSCSAFIASIHNSIDVARANGLEHIAAATGSTSESHIQQRLGLPDMAIVEMGDFAGAVLKYLRKAPVRRLSICGGFAKMSKLAAGHASLHSKDSRVDFDFLARLAEGHGAGAELAHAVRGANSSLQALQLCRDGEVPLGDAVCVLARQTAEKLCRESCAVDVYAIDSGGAPAGQSLHA